MICIPLLDHRLGATREHALQTPRDSARRLLLKIHSEPVLDNCHSDALKRKAGPSRKNAKSPPNLLKKLPRVPKKSRPRQCCRLGCWYAHFFKAARTSSA